jgi:uncharacterized membrane protein (DUF441 family)
MSIVVGIAVLLAFFLSALFSLLPYVRRKGDRGIILLVVFIIAAFSAYQLYEVSK